jgi:hypothetical protein
MKIFNDCMYGWKCMHGHKAGVACRISNVADISSALPEMKLGVG